LYAEEYIHGQLHKLKFRITKVLPGQEIIYKFLFPFSLFLPGGSFIIEPKGKSGCVFIATMLLRPGPVVAKILKNRIAALARHMREEGENIKKALDDVTPSDDTSYNIVKRGING
jgi:hypothetical protein